MLHKINWKRFTISLIDKQKRSLASNYQLLLDQKMKMMNDNKNYSQALTLFDKCLKENLCSSKLLFDQALRASIKLNDYKRATQIEDQLKSSWRNDKFIQTRLIILHSLTHLISLKVFETKEVFSFQLNLDKCLRPSNCSTNVEKRPITFITKYFQVYLQLELDDSTVFLEIIDRFLKVSSNQEN